MTVNNDPTMTADVVSDAPLTGIHTKEVGITRPECWEKYAELLKKYSGNENRAVRGYLAWLMQEPRTTANFNKLFITDKNRKEHVKALNDLKWLTDEDMNTFAASLGFRLTYVLTHHSHVPPYKSPENYAGFSVAENVPNAVVINSGNAHWRPFEHNVLGDGNCGAYTLASIARRFAPAKIKLRILAAENVAQSAVSRSSMDNPKSGLTLEQRENEYLQDCKARYEELDHQANNHAVAIKAFLEEKSPKKLMQILQAARQTALKFTNSDWLTGNRTKMAERDTNKTELIHVLTIEAKNTFHDPDNSFFRRLLASSVKDSRAIPKPLQQKTVSAIEGLLSSSAATP